jgi:ubiquinone/menaquinone biosynthesis C-methylase UbiE
MFFKVSEEKFIYSKKPEDPAGYTNKLNQAYSKYAMVYDIAVKFFPLWKTWIKKVIPHIEGRRVLEASFGTGYLLMQYAELYETYGIDYNSRMVQIARRNLSRKNISATLQQANVEDLPFPE